MEQVDIVVVRAIAAGMPCATEIVTYGAQILVVERADRLRGMLHDYFDQLVDLGARCAEAGAACLGQTPTATFMRRW